jgi:hypothetical protein
MSSQVTSATTNDTTISGSQAGEGRQIRSRQKVGTGGELKIFSTLSFGSHLMIGRCNSRVKPMNITHPLKMTLDRYDHPVRGPLNVCVLLCNPPTIPWVRGPLARVVRCGAGITPTTNEGHSPPLEREVKRLRPIVRSPPHHHLGARASGPPCAVWGWHYPHHKRRT